MKLNIKDYKPYSLARLDVREDGTRYLNGPFSPMEAAKTLAKHLEMPISNVIRWTNPETSSGLDYLAIRHQYLSKNTGKEESVYMVFMDLGVHLCPITLWDSKEPEELTLTEVFLENLTPERQQYQREDCEISNKKDMCYPTLTVDEWKSWCKQLHKLNLKPLVKQV